MSLLKVNLKKKKLKILSIYFFSACNQQVLFPSIIENDTSNRENKTKIQATEKSLYLPSVCYSYILFNVFNCAFYVYEFGKGM